MLLLHEIKRHILRTPGRTVITACVAALLVCGMAFYLRNIQVTQEALDELALQMPVRVRVTNWNCSSDINLRIEAADFDAIAAQDVRDVLCTSAFSFMIKPAGSQDTFMRVHAANAIAALKGPAPESFTYLDGWDESFLLADETVCAVERSFAKENGLKLGSHMDAEVFSLRWSKIGMEQNRVAHCNLTVVALYDETGGNSWNACAPIGWLREKTEAAVKVDGKPIPFYYDSASAYLANPREMNVFKDGMFKQGLQQRSVLPDKQFLGNVLSMDDEMYIKASADLIENLELYQTFLLPFCGLIIFIVALITFLTLRSCRVHIAIASSLGRQKLLNAAAPFFGTVTIQTFGGAFALLIMTLTVGLLPTFAGVILGSFILCASAGTTLALLFLFRFDTLTLLTKTD